MADDRKARYVEDNRIDFNCRPMLW